jgi:polysaccharide biosynthesis/export protein
MARWSTPTGAVLVAALLCTGGTGCKSTKPGYAPPLLHPCAPAPIIPNQPREMAKVAFPDYVIEPPDVLLIDAVRVVPLPPYRIEPLDVLAIMVTDALPQQPIQGLYAVEPDGTVNLGFTYGSVQVVDKTIEEAKAAVEAYLRNILKPGFQVSVAPSETRGKQQIAGQHLVRQDGKVSLGVYGAVPVAGLTCEQAKAAIEAFLSQFLLKPEVSVDVAGFNSKVYYVITDNLGANDSVYRQPTTGNETVLDALSQIYGLPLVASKERIWVARPNPVNGCDQIMPVDWVAITRGGRTETNYQILPGDRIYVQAQPILTFDSYLGKIIAPIERVFGIILLGTSTVNELKGGGGSNNNNNGF